jgi:hypothetical protein
VSAPEEECPDQKQSDRSEDGCYQPGAVLRLIPTGLLPEIRRRKGADDAKETGHHEPEQSLSGGRNQSGNHAGGQAECHGHMMPLRAPAERHDLGGQPSCPARVAAQVRF